MKIGKAAEASGVSAKMIRYYEGNEIVSRASRQANGYRVYSEVDVHTLRFVKRARDLGFSIAQIRRLVGLWRNAKRSSSDVKKIALAHVSELKQKIVELQSMVSALEHLASHCHGDRRPECPILDDLSGSRDAVHARRRSPGSRTGRAGRTRFAASQHARPRTRELERRSEIWTP
jgi:Cu(I)-responsive transcriptional regulator